MQDNEQNAMSGPSAAFAELDKNSKQLEEERKLKQSRKNMGKIIAVMSGKGGVGKSTVAINLAMALRMQGKKVGLLDVDIHGPSVPTMLGLEGHNLAWDGSGIVPIDYEGIKVISTGFIIPSNDEAIIWRGAMKMNAIQQFITDVSWGELDCLVVDLPPGTGDEPLSLCQLLEDIDGAVIVTTPQRVAEVDVRKSISFCRQLSVPILGIVENMSGFVCGNCQHVTPILRSGAGKKLAEEFKVAFLGALPIDPSVAELCDDGKPLVKYAPESPAAKTLTDIAQALDLGLFKS